jgi:hypothetical protein
MTGGYLDFDLSIWKEGDRYYAKVIDSPAGQSTKCHLPLPFHDLLQSDLQLRLENAVLRNVGHFRGPATQGEKILCEFGQQMFDAVFRHAEGIGDLFKASLNTVGQYQDKPVGLRVKLRIEPPELARLPWEYLYDGSKDDWVALRRRSPIVRFLDIDQPTGDLVVNGPINILGMIANPGGKKWSDLDVENERRNIDEALKPLVETGKIHLCWVPGETSRHLLSMMRKQIWHVFHFIGHGGISKDSDGEGGVGESEEGFIVLRDEKGGPEEVKARDLKLILGDGSLRLVVLNCCESGQGSIRDPFASPAAALVRHGIPAVVAMQFPISDSAAIELARGFYESLADNLPLERAITEARLLVRRKSNIEWGIPVLYTHSRTGRLFSNIQPSPGASPEQPEKARPPLDPRSEEARRRLQGLFNNRATVLKKTA